MAKKDLFDDTTMSFGEHLEELRIHLWKAIVGLVICVVATLFFGKHLIAFVRAPIDEALTRHGMETTAANDVGQFDMMDYLKKWFSDEEDEASEEPEVVEPEMSDPAALDVELSIRELQTALHEVDAEQFAAPTDDTPVGTVTLHAIVPELVELRAALAEAVKLRPVTFNVQEAFMTYLKVCFIAGLVFSSPWIFWQVWMFVAAGLYPHERRYVHYYLPISLGLFLGGAWFCFEFVFPFVLDFLLGFNKTLGVTPQIRLSEWISFALMLPMMFGLSFQLPLVMLAMERLSIFSADDYREKRRMAILVISIVSMLMTPSDPMSMIMMMVPLIVLYEVGILMCGFAVQKSPFEAEAA